jgi:hypothetical protein
MNTTICIQIGNADDKLIQQKWSLFCSSLVNLADEFGDIHFSGGPSTASPVQNYCVVVNVPSTDVDYFFGELEDMRATFGQNSAAVLMGAVKLV